jgi:uncharacterized protein YecE (DUF72 family)
MSPTPSLHAGCRLRVGTGGYAHSEWVAAGFYPPDTPAARMLPLYARRFAAVELNTTWYQLPRAETLERQRRQTPPGFRFAVKLTRGLTHAEDPRGWREQAAAYRDGLAPLVQAGQLAAVLIQLPSDAARTAACRRHLADLLESLDGLPLAVEFRHPSWACDRVLAELERRRATLVSVDGPRLPSCFPQLDVVTNPAFFYARLYGRNTAGWRAGHPRRRFDYRYGATELAEWIDARMSAMAGRARRGLIFFNNHVRAQAAADARQLVRLLGARGLAVEASA